MNRINIEKLQLLFPSGPNHFLQNVSCCIEQGEHILLLGPSGCGKSTLLQVMSGLIPHSIPATINASKLTTPASWGFVFQDPDTQFCMPYVDEEIAFVLENLQVPTQDMKHRIQTLLEMVGLQLPDSHIPISTLSGGMKQQLAMASVLAMNPDVLFLDEPTAMLDEEATRQLWQTVKHISHNKTLVIVEHKIPHVLDTIQRIILFDEVGNIIADGPKDLILLRYEKIMEEQGIWTLNTWRNYRQSTNRESHCSLNINIPNTNSEIPLLSLNNFIGYRNKVPTISIPHAHIHKGEWITIMGRNGAGKSTLFHSLMQFIQTTGEISIQKRLIRTTKDAVNYFCFVFQNPELQFVTHSTEAEMAYSLPKNHLSASTSQQLRDQLLDKFRLNKVRHIHPCQLSLGEKRRLSVAASLMQQRPIILLDEPTFGLDAQETFKLLEWLEEFRQQGLTILMSTHSQNIAETFATRLWRIHQGQLVNDIPLQHYRKPHTKNYRELHP